MESRDVEAAQEFNPPDELVARAREWWGELPSMYKGRCSIWMLLAMFAHAEKEKHDGS